MSTTRKSLEQIRKEGGGRINKEQFDRFTEADIERMAKEDGEDEWFDPNAKPSRIVKPYEPAE